MIRDHKKVRLISLFTNCKFIASTSKLKLHFEGIGKTALHLEAIKEVLDERTNPDLELKKGPLDFAPPLRQTLVYVGTNYSNAAALLAP